MKWLKRLDRPNIIVLVVATIAVMAIAIACTEFVSSECELIEDTRTGDMVLQCDTVEFQQCELQVDTVPMSTPEIVDYGVSGIWVKPAGYPEAEQVTALKCKSIRFLHWPTPVPGLTSIPTEEPESAPVPTDTPEPTRKPAQKPESYHDEYVWEPRNVPEPDPTQVPVPDPTKVPVPDPTKVPVPDPTKVPVPDPTKVPVPDPTKVFVPIPAPTQAPPPPAPTQAPPPPAPTQAPPPPAPTQAPTDCESQGSAQGCYGYNPEDPDQSWHGWDTLELCEEHGSGNCEYRYFPPPGQ